LQRADPGDADPAEEGEGAMPALLIAAFVLALIALAAVSALAVRARGVRRDLARELHDRALASDRRCDHLQSLLDEHRRVIDGFQSQLGECQHHIGRLQSQFDDCQTRIDTIDLRLEADHLLQLIDRAEAEGRLAPESSRHLRRYVLELRQEDESRSGGGGEGNPGPAVDEVCPTDKV